MNLFAEVAIDQYIDRPFDYRIPPNIKVTPGSFVEVPIKTRQAQGWVVRIKNESEWSHSIKSIEKVLSHVPIIETEMLKLGHWIANYYGCPLGIVLKCLVPSYILKTAKKERNDSQMFLAHKQVEFHRLNTEQQTALDRIYEAQQQKKHQVFLLWGITGSGKTEVYMYAIKNALSQGKSALIIVPEIALTPQLMRAFQERFPESISMFHSKMTDTERRKNWFQAAQGESRIVIGARSAVFAPLKKLGIIIVDEEHERSYKQEEAPKYNARDIAIVRAAMDNAVVVLGSATPSLESFYNCQKNKYELLTLSSRISVHKLSQVQIVDMRKEKSHFLFSGKLLHAIGDRLKKREQVILFLNRRGFSTCQHCPKCGHSISCPECSIIMTYHKTKGQLLCHRCDTTLSPFTVCPECKKSPMKLLGFGTEKVEKQIAKIFPTARISRIDTDTVSKRGILEQILNDLSHGKIDILVGTQMIAKGIHVEGVSLVGILSADMTLNVPDFRSGENTFQLVTQVAGRAGRGAIPGEVIIQSSCPEHPIIRQAMQQDYLSFYNLEMNYRKDLQYPPFKRFILIHVSHTDEKIVKELTEDFCTNLKSGTFFNSNNLKIYPPVPAPIPKIRSKYRYQILLSAKSLSGILKGITLLIQNRYQSHKKNFSIDVDPYSML